MDIQKTLEKVEKTLSTPTYIEGAILTRENLAAGITRLTDKETPIRDMLTRKKGSGLAASWNVLTAIGTGNSPFAEGGTPTEDDATYARSSAVYKELGKTKSVTDKMLAAGKDFIDQEAEQTEVAMREVIQDEEQLIITGDTGSSALEFDGMRTLITTNVIDDANDSAGFRSDLLDQAIETLLDTYSVRPTVIWVGYAMKRAINQSLAGDVRVNLDQGNLVSTGVEVGSYQSMVGKIPFVASYAIAKDSDTYSATQNAVSDIYVITQKTKGQDVIYMEDLYGMGKSKLDRTGAAIKFMITECTVLVCRAEQFNVRIANVQVE